MAPFGFWILDFGSWILDFGFWILDFGFWILDFGLGLGLLRTVWILHKIFPNHADSGRRILYIILYYIILCHVMLCYVMLCHVMIHSWTHTCLPDISGPFW